MKKPRLIVLREKIKKAQDAYHNTDEPIMSDEEYDALIDELELIAPKDPLLKKVGAKVKGRAVVLPRAMNSLPKVRVGEATFEKWVNNHPGLMEVTDKADGVSLEYGNDGDSYHLYTRGDGNVGTDVSHLIPHIKGLGDLPKGHAVRGELVVPKRNFAKLGGRFENARNLTAGIVNTGGVHANIGSALFVVHEYVQPYTVNLSKRAAALRANGFKVVQTKVFKNPTIAELEAYYKERMETATFDIDGLVLNVKGDRMALKAVNETVKATVKEVEWNVSRHGLLKPTVILTKAVRLAGANVSRATGHNARYIQENGIGPGATINIVRSGEVIPKIVGVITKAKTPQMPEGAWEWNGADIVSTEDETVDQTSLILSNFLTTIGVKNFKASMMRKLVDGGIDTVKKLVRVTERRLVACGFGDKQAETLVADMRAKMADVEHPRLMAASGVFPSGFGYRRLSTIMSRFPVRNWKDQPKDIVKRIAKVKGIGEPTAIQFAKYFPKYLKFMEGIDFQRTETKKPKVKRTLVGKSFAFTGVRDTELEAAILARGGKVSGVSVKTTYIVAKPGFRSAKTDKAKELGLKPITLEQARRLVLG